MIDAAQSPSKNGLQPLDLHQRVLALLVYLDQHGFSVSYELWADKSAAVWMLRPIDKSARQTEFQHEPCQKELYFSWAREIVQLDQKMAAQPR